MVSSHGLSASGTPEFMGIEVDEVPAFDTGGDVGRRSATRFETQLLAFCKAVRKSSPEHID